ELFMMYDNGCISDMFTRFTTLINSLKNLGKSYPNHELVRKILRYLPKSWTPKVMAIKEVKDLSTVPLKQKEELTCFECKKSGHFKSDCPSLKKKEQFKKSNEHSKKKKAMIATWSDSDYLSFEDESEVANNAFMATEEKDDVQFSFDELQNAYENLYNEYENVCLKNKYLQKNVNSLSKEIESLKNDNINYKNEIKF
ncbi:LOW QUALITY PROTEIN: zf-CCHC domain-containing protein/UBN2 domain-containing protein, partial [Cephalotus follicularis]